MKFHSPTSDCRAAALPAHSHPPPMDFSLHGDRNMRVLVGLLVPPLIMDAISIYAGANDRSPCSSPHISFTASDWLLISGVSNIGLVFLTVACSFGCCILTRKSRGVPPSWAFGVFVTLVFSCALAMVWNFLWDAIAIVMLSTLDHCVLLRSTSWVLLIELVFHLGWCLVMITLITCFIRF